MPTNIQVIQSLLSEAQITLNGPSDTDIQVMNPDFYSRILRDGLEGGKKSG